MFCEVKEVTRHQLTARAPRMSLATCWWRTTRDSGHGIKKIQLRRSNDIPEDAPYRRRDQRVRSTLSSLNGSQSWEGGGQVYRAGVQGSALSFRCCPFSGPPG